MTNKIVQIHSVLIKGDAISNVMRSNNSIIKDAGMDAEMVVDFFSEYENEGIELADLDFNELAPISKKMEYFLRVNKKYIIKEYIPALLKYKKGIARKIMEKADMRIWHYGLMYPLVKLINENDFVYFHNFSYPYLTEYPAVEIDASRTLQDLKYIPMSFITHSEFNKETLYRLGFVNNDIHMLPAFHKVKKNFTAHDTKEPNLLAYGRYARNKRFPELTKISKEMNVNLTIFGDNYTVKEYKNEYKKCKEYAKDSKKISINGKLDSIDGIHEMANIYVCNSNHEGWNTPTTESMAHSIPALVRNGTGAAEQITDGQNGYLYDSIDELPALVEKTIRNYGVLSYNAWKKAQEYTYDVYSDKLMKIIKGGLK